MTEKRWDQLESSLDESLAVGLPEPMAEMDRWTMTASEMVKRRSQKFSGERLEARSDDGYYGWRFV